MKKFLLLVMSVIAIPIFGNIAVAQTSVNSNVNTKTDQSMHGGMQYVVSYGPDEVAHLSTIQPSGMNLSAPYAPPMMLNKNRMQLPGLVMYRYDELDHDFDKLIRKLEKYGFTIQYTEKYKTLEKNTDDIYKAAEMPVGKNDVRLITIIAEPPANALPEEVARLVVSLGKIITQTRRIFLEAEVEVLTNSESTSRGASPSGASFHGLASSWAGLLSMIKSETGTRAFRVNKIIVYCYNDGSVAQKTKTLNTKELIFFDINGVDNIALNLNKKLLADRIKTVFANNYKIRFFGVGFTEDNGLTEKMTQKVMREVGLNLSEAELNMVLDNGLFQYQTKTAEQQNIELIKKYNSKGYITLRVIK